MLDEKHYGGRQDHWSVIAEAVRFPDTKAAVVVIGSILFLILLLGVLPRWLRMQEADDLRGVAALTVPGVVAQVHISPVSQGGGGLFNAVGVAFAGRQAYYALPPSSQWRPKIGQPVAVTYRMGRHSGLAHIDAVLPTSP